MKLAGRQQGITLTNKILAEKEFNNLLKENRIFKGEPPDDALRREVKEMTKDCPTCDDH